MAELTSRKHFKKTLIESDDYDVLIKLIKPHLLNFGFKNKRHNSWDNIFAKFSKILTDIYKKNFEHGFQCQHFSEHEKNMLIHIFKFLQRIQTFSNNFIDLYDCNLYLPYALCFDFEVALECFKVISLLAAVIKIYENNKTHIEILLKIINLPEIRVKQYLYDEYYSINETGRSPMSDPLEYFNTNKMTSNLTDLYLEAHKIMCSEEQAFIIKIYSIISTECPVIEYVNILQDLKKFTFQSKNSLEMKYLLDVFVLHLIRTDRDKEIIRKTLESDGWLIERLKYDENSTFENISIFSNITKIDLNIKYRLTSTASNPDLDFQYYSGLYKLMKKETDVFTKCFDLDEFKDLLENFDIYHQKKDRLVLKILFKIINETYTKSSAYFEPFEDSNYLKKCKQLIKEQSDKFSSLCCRTISFFINEDPLSIPMIVDLELLEIFKNFKGSNDMNFAVLNLLDDFSLNQDLRNKLIEEKVLYNFLDEILFKQDFKSKNFLNCFNKFLQHHVEYKPEFIKYIEERIRVNVHTESYFNFVSSHKSDYSKVSFWEDLEYVKIIESIVINNYDKNLKWRKALFKSLESKFFYLISFNGDLNDWLYSNSLKLQKYLQEENYQVMESLLYFQCCIIFTSKKGFRDYKNLSWTSLYSLFNTLLLITLKIFSFLEDKKILDLWKTEDLYERDIKYIIWIEINYLFKFFFSCSDYYMDRYFLTTFLNLITDRQNDIEKRNKIEKYVIDDFSKECLKLILFYNIEKWETFNMRILFDWIQNNLDVLSFDVISEFFYKVKEIYLNKDEKNIKWISNYILQNNFDNKILKLYDNLISNSTNTFKDEDIIKSIYYKYYTSGFEIKYKPILDNLEIQKIILEDFNFMVFYDKIDLCIKYMQEEFKDNEKYLLLCFYTFRYCTFYKVSFSNNIDIDLILRSKNFNTKYKLIYILSYIKYMKSQRKDFTVLNKIVNFSLKHSDKKKHRIIIKCIMHQIFEHSKDVITDFTKPSTIDVDFHIFNCYYDIYSFNKGYRGLLEDNKNAFVTNMTAEKQKEFEKIMRKSLKNIHILNILTEILCNNPEYTCMIKKKFISKLFKKYIDSANLTRKIVNSGSYFIAFRFLGHCLKFNEENLLKMIYKLIFKKIGKCKDHKIYNYLVILYGSLETMNYSDKEDFDSQNQEKFSDNLIKFFIKHKIGEKLFQILSTVKEKDLELINIENKSDAIKIQKWDNINDKNKISFIYSFLSKLYWSKIDILHEWYEDYDSRSYYEDSEFVEWTVSENVTPENSSNSEVSKLKPKSITKIKVTDDKIYPAYYLCLQEYKILEKFSKTKFIDEIFKVLKNELLLREKVNIIDKEETNSNEMDDWEEYHDYWSPHEYMSDEENSESDSEDDIQDNLNIYDTISGEENGIVPDISVEEINQFNEIELDLFIKEWYSFRKSLSSTYIPIDKTFLNNISEKFRWQFIESEIKLKKDYFLYAPKYEKVEKPAEEKIENLKVYISEKIFGDFLKSYISEDYTLKKEISDLMTILCYNKNLKKVTLDILNEKIKDRKLWKKCLQIFKSIIFSVKDDVKNDKQLIDNLLFISTIKEYSKDGLFLLSNIKCTEEVDVGTLNLLTQTANLILTTKSWEFLEIFCKNNISSKIILFISKLLESKENNISLIVNLACHFFDKNLDPNFIEPEIFNELENCACENYTDNTNLTLFAIYEKLIYYGKTDEDIIKRFKMKKDKLKIFMKENQEDINKSLIPNDLLIDFLSKNNILNFTNKKNFFDSKLWYYRSGELTFTVNRKTILNDSFCQVINRDPKELKHKCIKIIFKGEQGDDYGGLKKEWFELVMQSAVDPNYGLFVYSSDIKSTVYPYKNSKINPDHLIFFRFLGRIFALIIMNKFNVGVHFNKSVYKYLIEKQSNLEDLEEIDPQYYNSLVWIKNNPIYNVIFLNFTVESFDLGILEVIELIPNGKNILVTDENKNEYIDLVVKNKFVKSIEPQLKAIKDGIHDLLDPNLINIFNEKELELLLCGIPDINVEDWKSNTEYHGYNKNSKNIIWFWKAVEGFTPDEKALLLQFCTSSSRVPYGGFKNLQSYNGFMKFSIHRTTVKRLPAAHTCFNQLDLPEYESYEELRKNIIYAINECKGGFELV